MAGKRAEVAVVGVGHSPVFRRAEVPLGALAVDACRMAIADAGLKPSDIDGVATDPDQPFDGAGAVDGVDLVNTPYIIGALGLEVGWAQRVNGMVGHAFIEAVNAVAGGSCNYALIFRALRNPPGRYGNTSPKVAPGRHQYTAPYGLFAPAMFSYYATRYFHVYGGGPQQLATFAVQNRRNGLLWEHSYWRQHRPETLTIADYLAAPMVSSPLTRLDCDIPLDGCGAFVLTTAERARDHAERPAYVLGSASPLRRPAGVVPSLEEFRAGGAQLGRHLFASAGVGPGDVQVAQLYDGFSILAPLWLEAMGLCKEGEAFQFIHEGRTAIDGELPLNTCGGNQGAGRMHGVPHLMEAAMQVMRRSGPRQVANADVSLAVVGPLHQGAGVVFGSAATS